MNPLIEEEDPGLALEVYDPSLERDYVRRIKVELLKTWEVLARSLEDKWYVEGQTI